MESIYLDHNATTPTQPEVVEAMTRCHAQGYANPASQHRPGQQARRLLEDAREPIAEILGADLAPPRRDRLIFTSSGTEANNLAMLGMALAGGSAAWPDHHLGRRAPERDRAGRTPAGAGLAAGHLGADARRRGSRRSIAGACSDSRNGAEPRWSASAWAITRRACCNRWPSWRRSAPAGVPLHTDAVQVVGKLPVDFRRLGVAAMSVSAHKFGGPAGIGGLWFATGSARAADVRRASAVGSAAGHGIGRVGRRHGHRAGALAPAEQAEDARRLAARDRFERR